MRRIDSIILSLFLSLFFLPLSPSLTLPVSGALNGEWNSGSFSMRAEFQMNCDSAPVFFTLTFDQSLFRSDGHSQNKTEGKNGARMQSRWWEKICVCGEDFSWFTCEMNLFVWLHINYCPRNLKFNIVINCPKSKLSFLLLCINIKKDYEYLLSNSQILISFLAVDNNVTSR